MIQVIGSSSKIYYQYYFSERFCWMLRWIETVALTDRLVIYCCSMVLQPIAKPFIRLSRNFHDIFPAYIKHDD